MRIRTYKLAVVVLGCFVIALGYYSLSLTRQVAQASFISSHASDVRGFIKDAKAGRMDRDSVLFHLNFYIANYDSQTNALARSPLQHLLKTEREYVVRDALQYLRKNSTNDWGDDIYKWFENEHVY